MKHTIPFSLTAIILALFTLTTISGCKKETTTAVATCTDGIKNGTETGVDCGGSCTACPSTSYYPLTTGTVRTYDLDILGVHTAVDSVSSKDTLIGGLTYRIVNSTYQGYAESRYFRISNGNIYVRYNGGMPQLDYTDGLQNQEFLIMKEDAAVGNTWILSADNGGLQPYVREVMETGVMGTVGTHMFHNICVIHQYSQGSPGTYDVIYYAKGVGFIQGGSNIQITGYSIK